MTQRNRRRHRRRGGGRSKLLFVVAGAFAIVAVLLIGVASWVLDVAAKAPPLSDCRPIDKGGNSILFAGDGTRLGYIASDEARTPVSIEDVPTDLSTPRSRSRTSASTSTTGSITKAASGR